MTDYPKPAVRRLKVYAFDPQASVTLSTAMINESVIELPWEERWEEPLKKGPINDYVEVIDYDPASRLFYAPVDLNHPDLLAQNGLDPAEGRPQFHQQMAFAVVMSTIRSFERALGRTVLWARDDKVGWKDKRYDKVDRNFTRRLRIYPHALREANAYYSPTKRALLFGYFRPEGSAADVQANWVFTCLSRDIVAHETTHAILHGMRQRSIESSSADALAFHEAFSDIIALLQHFSLQPVVRHLLAASNGSLRTSTLLTGLAEQFGKATGRDGALRYALKALGARSEQVDANSAKGIEDAVATLRKTTEPHARGAFLVAAVFDAFVTIYERRTEDLFRLARPGLVEGNGLGPDLVNRLAREAAQAADQVMRMCIRALDYTPPVDLRFGEYLRGIITADNDLVPSDPLRYRVAFVEAFKRWGITVPGCISMAPDSLVWDPPDYEEYPEIKAFALHVLSKHGTTPDTELADPADALSIRFTDMLSKVQTGVSFSMSTEKADSTTYRPMDYTDHPNDSTNPARNLRTQSMRIVLHNQQVIHEWFNTDCEDDEDWERLLGLRLRPESRHVGMINPTKKRAERLRSIDSSDTVDGIKVGWSQRPPLFEVNPVRISKRTGPDGQELHLLICHVTQKRRGYFDPKEQSQADAGKVSAIGKKRWEEPDFWFRGGATLHIDLRDGRLLRAIRKRIDKKERLEEERAFRCGETTDEGAAVADPGEPFALVHRSA